MVAQRNTWARAWVCMLLWASGCLANDIYPCSEDAQCSGEASANGRCLEGWCAYQDDSCSSTWRYSKFAGGGFASSCVAGVDESSGTSTVDGSTTSTDSFATTEVASSTSVAESSEAGDPCDGVLCEGGEVCIGGVCAEPPDDGVCEPRDLPDAFCNGCAADHCCEPLEACVGDEDDPPGSMCHDLVTCIDVAVDSGRPECVPDMGGSVNWVTCILAACPDFIGGVDEWEPLRACLDDECPVSCS